MNQPATMLPSEPAPPIAALVAFEGFVELHKWAETSGNGRRVWLKLADREALAHFEKVTKRRGGKGGQRYRLFLADEDGVLLEGFPDEAWFIGASWSHTTGASITLELMEFGAFASSATADNSATNTGARFHLTLVQLDEQEQPINQAQAEKAAELEAKLKGGSKSKQAAILFKADDFRRFVAIRLYGNGATGEHALATPEQADEWAKRVAGFKSKIELDHSPEVWERYQNRVMRWFLSWARSL